MSEPTKQQIDQADRLQKVGLCRESEQWILNRYKTQDYSIQKKSYAGSPWFITGPLPTFEEVWPVLMAELKMQIQKGNRHTFGAPVAMNLIVEQMQRHGIADQPTTAAIEALLLIKAGS